MKIFSNKHHVIIATDASLRNTGRGLNTIVFLHGVGGTTRYWKQRVQPPGARYRLFLVDLIGYGQSPKPWTKYTVERHSEELYQVLREQGSLRRVG